MNCSKCGTGLADGAVICSVCGASVEQKKPEKKFLIAILAAIVFFVLCVAVFFGAQALSNLFGGSSQSKSKEDKSYQVDPYMVVVAEDEALVYSGAPDPVKIEGDSFEEYVSLDGKTVGFAMDMVDPDHFSLVVYNGTDILEATEDVSFFRVSDDGSKVIYLVNDDTDNYSATLYSYDVSSRKIEKLAEGVFPAIKPVISPDGKSICYFTSADNGYSGSAMAYVIKDGGDAEELGEDIFPFAVSDNAEYIYYMKNDGDLNLFVLKNGNEVKISMLKYEYTFYFNKDYSELLFTSGGETYMSIDGAEAEKISSNSLVSIVPPNQTNIAFDFNGLFGQRIDVASLKDHVVTMTSDTGFVVAYMNSSYKISEIASIETEEQKFYTLFLHKYCDGVQVSGDNQSLYFVNENGDLLLYSNYRDPKVEPVRIAENVDSLYLSFDESLVYFIANTEGKDLGIFVGTLYVMDNKAGAVPKEIDQDVFRVRTSSYGDVYYVFEEHVYDHGKEYAICEAFYSRDGMTFESIADEANCRY